MKMCFFCIVVCKDCYFLFMFCYVFVKIMLILLCIFVSSVATGIMLGHFPSSSF
jgi:hypothetical protein